MVLGGVVHQLPEVGTNGRLATSDVHVEDLHPLELIDDGLALIGAQLSGISPARAGEAVHAGQIAGVGQLPGEADRRVQPLLEPVDQPTHVVSHCRRRRGSRLPGSRYLPLADHPGLGQGGERPLVAAHFLPSDACGPTGVVSGGLPGQGLHHAEQAPALQEGEPAGTEVVGQRSERFRPQGDLGMESPGSRAVKGRGRTRAGSGVARWLEGRAQ